jgi:phosphoribosylformylglycinamidine cyclo-ligase
MDYEEAGVNIREGYRAVGKYRELSATTANDAVLNSIGSFAGMFSLKELIRSGQGMEEPVLVSGTDGVGTKLELAFRTKKYDTVGIDCVAMCVNDVLCHGARPLFFLDYLACGKLDADVAGDLVKGVATGCREAGCALLGGETAEMPGFYDAGKYDIAGFCVGIVERKRIVDGSKIREGDALIGIGSSGPHSNGFSLIRKILPNLDEDFYGKPIVHTLLAPTQIYVKEVLALMEKLEVRGMAHITGGGFYENIPRIFSPSLPLAAEIREGAWPLPAIFARIAAAVKGEALSGEAAVKRGMDLLQSDAALKRMMFNTFNMGIGFVLALAPEDSAHAIACLKEQGLPAWQIGTCVKRSQEGLSFHRFSLSPAGD